MTGWESIGTQIDRLQTVEGLKGLSFFVHKPDQGNVKLCARLPSLPSMSENDAKTLADDLNKAIELVVKSYIEGMLSKTANQLRRFL